MNTFPRLSLIVSVAAGLASCSSNPDVNIGDPVGSALVDYAARWDGYAEAYQFHDQSDRVRLFIDRAGTGTLQIGDSPAVPPATDPDAAYPPAAMSKEGGIIGDVNGGIVYAGFGYPIYGTRVEDSRIRLGIDPRDIYASWCTLQQPVSDGGAYVCQPDWAGVYNTLTDTCWQTNPSTLEMVRVNCARLALCAYCTCTASACTVASTPDSPPIQLDAALTADGAQLTGTLVLDGQRITVRMHR